MRWVEADKGEKIMLREHVNDPALKGGACDSPEVRMIAEAVSFLKVGSHCRVVDSTLTTAAYLNHPRRQEIIRHVPDSRRLPTA